MFLLDKIIHCYENITPFQTTVAIAVIFLYVLYLFVRDMDVPPGPRGFPVLGYWPFLKTDTCHLQLDGLSKKYGDVFSFTVAGNLLINLGSIKSIREAHITKSDSFAERYQDCLLDRIFGKGVPFLKGEHWKILRKYFVAKFKEYGLNTVKDNAAPAVYDSMREMVDELRCANGRPIKVNDMITLKCIVIMRRIMFNDQGISMKEIRDITAAYSEMMKEMTTVNIMLIGKFARYCMFPFMPCIWRIDKYNKRIEAVLYEVIKRHKSNYNDAQAVDLIDYYLKERDERKRKGDPTVKYFADEALLNTLNQMLTDGILTVCVFIVNFLIALAKYPEEQEKVYREIAEVIGTDRLPTLEDKTALPYTNAFFNEVQRLTDFFPGFPSLICTKETTVQGYKIPEGAITFLNFYSAHRNPKYFENPDEFNPSRFLPSSGKQRPDLPILFGIGKRACIGEGFSMIQTFLLVTTIAQNFRLTFPDSGETASGAFCAKEQPEICAVPRHHK